MNAVAFTGLVPVWAGDDAAAFAEALASLESGPVIPDRVLICEDGPLPARLAEIAARFAGRFGAMRVVNPGPRGLAANLNHAMSFVETPWAARADADDLNLPGRFALQSAFAADHPEVAAFGGAIVEFFPDGRERLKALPTEPAALARFAAWRNPINHMTAFFRTAAFRACGGYPAIPFKEDYGLWLAMLERGHPLANLAQPLVRARLGAGFHARRAGWRNLASEAALWRLKRDVPGIGRARGAAAFLARAGALSVESVARLAYERALRPRSRHTGTPLPGQATAS